MNYIVFIHKLIIPTISVALLGVSSVFVFPEQPESGRLVGEIESIELDLAKPDGLPEVAEQSESIHLLANDLDTVSSEYIQMQADIDNFYYHLLNYGSVVADRNIAEIVVSTSYRYGADYRIIGAIMLNESGHCRVPYMKYNCFGYLNGVQYASFEDAFIKLTPQIAKIVAQYNWDTLGLARRYGAQNQEVWANKIMNIARGI